MQEGYRHELKFLISRESANLLRVRLPRVMGRDPHAGPHGVYTIRSLYFDDFARTAYEEKVSGLEARTKYRIRYYNYDTRLLKLEKKEKLGDLTRKTAQTLSLCEARDLCAGRYAPLEGLARELQLAALSTGLRPAVLVDYDRTPFVCRAGNTRITLDENLRTRPHSLLLEENPGAMVPVLGPDQAVLEVKFDDFLPGYLRDVLADIPKDRLAISKFALCTELL